jgi:gamma-glutamyltranspeptidase/glutathione hydrolase
VTVPGAVAGWAALAERGRLGLDGCLEDAIDAAEGGCAVTPRTATSWAHIGGPLGDPPAVGDVVYQPELGVTLRRIADEGPSAFYTGEVAEAICEVSWLEEADLAGFEPRWVEPLRLTYKGTEAASCRPPRRASARLRDSGCWNAPHRRSRARSAASSSRSRTPSRACATGQTWAS